MAAPKVDAPMRKLPAMTSTKPTESADASSEKERSSIEKGMQKEVDRVLMEFSTEAEAAVEAQEEPDYDKLKKALLAVLLLYLVRAFMDYSDTLEQEYDVDFDPADTATAAGEWAGAFAVAEAARLVATTQRAVSAIAGQYATGAITAEMIGELLGPTFSADRANLIAITLVTEAQSAALDFYRAQLERMGLKVETFWVAQVDERTCGVCGALHEQPQLVWETQFPDGPPAHGRCRCKRRMEITRVS